MIFFTVIAVRTSSMIHLSSVGRVFYALSYPADGGSTFLRNVGEHLPDYLALNPKESVLRSHRRKNLKPHTVILSGEALLPTCLPTEGGSTFFRNVGKHVLDYTVSHPKRQYSFII
jgi:hypothetical protein